MHVPSWEELRAAKRYRDARLEYKQAQKRAMDQFLEKVGWQESEDEEDGDEEEDE